MQVRQALVAALLAVTAVAAMSQEIDRSETLQAKNLAAQQAQKEARIARSQEASSQPAKPDATPEAKPQRAEQTDRSQTVPATKASWVGRHARHTYARQWLKGDKRQPRPAAIADLG